MTLLAIQEVVLGQEAGHPEENVAGPDHAPEVRAAHLPGGDLTPSLRRGPPAPTHPDAQDPVLAHKPFFFFLILLCYIHCDVSGHSNFP